MPAPSRRSHVFTPLKLEAARAAIAEGEMEDTVLASGSAGSGGGSSGASSGGPAVSGQTSGTKASGAGSQTAAATARATPRAILQHKLSLENAPHPTDAFMKGGGI